MKIPGRLGALSIAALVCLIGVGLPAHPAEAVFMDLGIGAQFSGWEFDTPADVSITNVTTPGGVTGTTTNFILATTFFDLEPKTVRFRTKAGNDQKERFFMMDMNVTNASGTDWSAFFIETTDLLDAVFQPDEEHPKWAHIHPRHTVGGGPNYSPFLTFDPNTKFGVPDMTLSNGIVPFTSPFNTVWSPQRIRLHDKSTTFKNAGPMDFDLTIEPLPEPGTPLLMGSGLAGLVGALRWRRGQHTSS